MKKYLWMLCIAMTPCLITTAELEARAGGRGGGGVGPRGGGGPRSSGGAPRNMNRTPSLSRASSVPRGPNTSNISKSNVNPSNLRGPGNRPLNTSVSRNQVSQFLQNNPSGQNLQTRAANAQRSLQPSQLASQWQNNGNSVRSNLANNPNHNNLFRGNFWQNHQAPAYLGQNGNFWRAATAASIGGWLGWGNRGYDGYYYGGGGSYYPYDYQSDYPSSTPTYSQQETPIAINPSSQQVSANGWLPLGVFAVTNQGLTNVDPNFYVQLALNKQGLIAGTFYNSLTNQTYQIEGVVDPKTQRAAWMIAGNLNSPIAQTGLYNLTLPQTPVQVSFTNGQQQDVLLVRLDEQK